MQMCFFKAASDCFFNPLVPKEAAASSTVWSHLALLWVPGLQMLGSACRFVLFEFPAFFPAGTLAKTPLLLCGELDRQVNVARGCHNRTPECTL